MRVCVAPFWGNDMDEDKQETLDMLKRWLAEERAIFDKYKGRVINPDNTEGYAAAKKAFDRADRNIKEIEKEIAALLTAEKVEPSFLDEIMDKVKKLVSDDEPKDSVVTGVR
jgi:hypothetical protein